MFTVKQEQQLLALVVYGYDVYGTGVWKIFQVQLDVGHRGDLHQHIAADGKQVLLKLNYVRFVILQKDGLVAGSCSAGRVYVYQ